MLSVQIQGTKILIVYPLRTQLTACNMSGSREDLDAQVISHYLSQKALKCEDGEEKSNWESVNNIQAHREGALP